MPQFPPVPAEVVAQARASLARRGIDARPVFVVGPGLEHGHVEFLTADGRLWPVILRVGADGVTAARTDQNGQPSTTTPQTPAPLAEALDRLMSLLETATPRFPAPEAAE